MPKHQLRSIRPLVLLTGLLFAGVALTLPAQGQSLQKTVPPSIQTGDLHPAESYSYVFLDPLEGNHHAAKANDGQHQSIQMHGHWIIDVKNPDGTIAQHRDFENTLVGPAVLVGFMSGYTVPSDYAIALSLNNTQAPCPTVSNQSGCLIVRSLTSAPGSVLCVSLSCATGLTYTVSGGSFTLAGSFTASRSGGIYDVETFAGFCPNTTMGVTTISPASCTASGNTATAALSAASIPAVPVVASQIVQVTVTITFS